MPLHPRAVAALANLPHREGKVFRTHYGAVLERDQRPVGTGLQVPRGKGGGQVKTAWPKMLKRAGWWTSRRTTAATPGRPGTTPPTGTSPR
jgi:hypothetical protein